MTQISSPGEQTTVSVNRVPIVGARGQLTTTNNTTVYTAPALVEPPNGTVATAMLVSLILSNMDSADRTIAAHLVESGGSVATNRTIIPTITIKANTMVVIAFGERECPLESGEFLNLKAGTADTIAYRVNVELLPQ